MIRSELLCETRFRAGAQARRQPEVTGAVRGDADGAAVAGQDWGYFYDAIGNLLFDGRWRYAWDGENRLVSMETDSEVGLLPNAPPRLRLEFVYDGGSRRVGKVVKRWQTGAEQWVTIASWKYLYEGWILIAELDGLRSDALERGYVWGLDLSGTFQGAGGVGGLLGVYDDRQGKVYSVMTEVNGNVMGLVDAMSGHWVARYDYDAFGNRITAAGPLAGLCPVGFSTKYTDAETGLCYYGYRYYDAVRGRWINRDPIEEEGGLNLYGMIGNDSVSNRDVLGLIGAGNGMYLPGATPGPFGPAYINHPDYGKNPEPIPNTFHFWNTEPCGGSAETRFIQVVENAPWGLWVPFTDILLLELGRKMPFIDDGKKGRGNVGDAVKETPFFPTFIGMRGDFVPSFEDVPSYDSGKLMKFHLCRVCACRDHKNIFLSEVGPCKEWKTDSLPANLGEAPDVRPSNMWKNTLRSYMERNGGRLVEVRGSVFGWWTKK